MLRRRTLNSRLAGLISCSLALLIGLRAEAQPRAQPSGQLPPRAASQPQQNQPQPRPPQNQLPPDAQPRPRPEAAPLVVEPLPPELEQILRNWEIASSRIKTLEGQHRRWVFDDVFNVEKQAQGVFYYTAPDKGRIDLLAVKIAKDAVSSRTDEAGNPYKLESDYPEKWICTGKEILQIDDEKKEFEVYPLPPDVQGTHIMDGPLPFLFGMPAEKAKRRFKLRLIGISQTQIRLAAEPRLQQDAVNYKEAEIILSRETYLPIGVKLLDPSGNLETRYAFGALEVNKPRGGLLTKLWGEKDPFRPDLKGYKILQGPQAAQQPAGGAPPARAAQGGQRPPVIRR